MICKPKNVEGCISIELKVRDWRGALAQAMCNFQLSEQSYIAIWHEHVDPIWNNLDLLEFYGVGLIEVSEDRAELVLSSTDRVKRLARKKLNTMSLKNHRI